MFVIGNNKTKIVDIKEKKKDHHGLSLAYDTHRSGLSAHFAEERTETQAGTVACSVTHSGYHQSQDLRRAPAPCIGSLHSRMLLPKLSWGLRARRAEQN